jgi:hypothetical protein
MRFGTSLAVLLLNLLMGATVRADGSFHFKPPAGWANVSSGDIGGNLSKLVQPEFVEQIRKANFAVYAFDPAAGPAENMNVVLRDGAASITDSAVTTLSAGVSDTLLKMVGSKAEVTEATTFELHGARCGRVMYNFALNGKSERGVAYLLPSATQVATLTFTAPKDVFERHLSLYEASVAATEGIAQPTTGLPSWMYVVIGAGAAAAASAATRRRKARNEKKGA